MLCLRKSTMHTFDNLSKKEQDVFIYLIINKNYGKETQTLGRSDDRNGIYDRKRNFYCECRHYAKSGFRLLADCRLVDYSCNDRCSSNKLW